MRIRTCFAALAAAFLLIGAAGTASAADFTTCDPDGATRGVMYQLRAFFGMARGGADLSEGRACYAFTDTSNPDNLIQVQARAANFCVYPDIDATDTGTATVDIDRALYTDAADAGEFEEVASLDGIEATSTFCKRLPRGVYRVRVEACSSCNGVVSVTVDE